MAAVAIGVRQEGCVARAGESPLERALGWFLVVIMGVSVVNVLWQVFTRFALASPSSYTEELARYLLIWIGLVGAGYASAKRLHLAIDLLPRRISGGRSGRALAVIIELCVITFAGVVLLGGGLRLVHITLRLGQTSAALGIPMGWVYAAVPVSGALIVWFSARRLREVLRGQAGT
jgi:TRAP-type C4-dicarboxylate transport system permease small subunit